MAGYSGTPLIKKLGLRTGMRVHFLDMPKTVQSEMAPILPEVQVSHHISPQLDYIHAFFRSAADMEQALPRLKEHLARGGMLWLSWPKKASKLPSDLSDEVVRRLGLGTGLVDVKVCAVDDQWSGLKFVYRKRDR